MLKIITQLKIHAEFSSQTWSEIILWTTQDVGFLAGAAVTSRRYRNEEFPLELLVLKPESKPEDRKKAFLDVSFQCTAQSE